jgi:hypothetical protein
MNPKPHLLLTIRNGARVFCALGEPLALRPLHPINFQKLKIHEYNFRFIYMIKEINTILNEHCHCSTLYAKYVLKEIGLHLRI